MTSAVIDSDDDDVDDDWVTTSNLKLAKRLDREEARESKAKGKQKAPRPRPPPRLSPAHRATPPLAVYAAHESATASSARPKTDRPSLSTGTPDQAAGVGNANLNQQQVEDQDADMVQVCLPFLFFPSSVLFLVISALTVRFLPLQPSVTTTLLSPTYPWQA
jgi:hypothetical protein